MNKREKELLYQEMEILVKESKNSDSSHDVARLAEAMCHIQDRLERIRIRMYALTVMVIMLTYLSICVFVKI